MEMYTYGLIFNPGDATDLDNLQSALLLGLMVSMESKW
jgi:hypothetical protein